MKLKPNPTKTAVSPENLPLERAAASTARGQVSAPAAVGFPPLEQPFESFVRSLMAPKRVIPDHRPFAGTIPSAEEVIAETEVDGVRYVILRYERSAQEPNVSLSPREQEIVHLIAKGFPNKAIADVLDISTWTVGTHLRRIFAKMGVTSRAAMVAKHLHVKTGTTLPRGGATRTPL